MKVRAILLMAAMVAALIIGSGAAMAVEKAKDAPTKKENATKESTVQDAPDATTAKAASATGSEIRKGFGNETPIQIPSVGQASPYPSDIEVSGFPEGSRITDVDLALVGFSHDFPLDVDVLLVGPTGRKRLVMSDVGGQGPVGSIGLSINDEAPSRFSVENLRGGSFKPTNNGRGDTFPSPAPALGRKSSLSGFDGTNPNGTWKLFVVDDAAQDSGSIQFGWVLGITAKS